MIIESLVLGAGAAVVSAGHRAVQEHRRQRTERELAEMQFRMLLTSQQVHAKASAARKAMVEEVRRHQDIGQYRGGGQ